MCWGVAVNCDGTRRRGNSHLLKYRGFAGRNRLLQIAQRFWHGGCNLAWHINQRWELRNRDCSSGKWQLHDRLRIATRLAMVTQMRTHGQRASAFSAPSIGVFLWRSVPCPARVVRAPSCGNRSSLCGLPHLLPIVEPLHRAAPELGLPHCEASRRTCVTDAEVLSFGVGLKVRRRGSARSLPKPITI